MPVYTDPRTNKFYIQFDYKKKTYKRRLPDFVTLEDAEYLAEHWKDEVINGKKIVVLTPDQIKVRREMFVESLPMEQFGFSRSHWLTLYRNIERGAIKRNLSYDLSLPDFWSLVLRSEGRCELTKIPFSLEDSNLAPQRPFIPSVDRIDCKTGYTIENCRLVCCAVNIALNQWGEGVLLKIARALVEQNS